MCSTLSLSSIKFYIQIEEMYGTYLDVMMVAETGNVWHWFLQRVQAVADMSVHMRCMLAWHTPENITAQFIQRKILYEVNGVEPS